LTRAGGTNDDAFSERGLVVAAEMMRAVEGREQASEPE
jgi:hypothetical protein